MGSTSAFSIDLLEPEAACVHPIVSEKFGSKGRAFRSAGFAVRSFQPRDRATIPDYIRLTDIRAVVEVVPAADGKLPERLLWNAYRASRSGVIALALTSVTVEAVDRVMDGIVPHFPLNIPGVVYIDARNRPLLAWVLDQAELIFGQTNEFRRLAPKTSTILMPHLLGESGLGVPASASSGVAALFINSIGAQRLATGLDTSVRPFRGGRLTTDRDEGSTAVTADTGKPTGRKLGEAP